MLNQHVQTYFTTSLRASSCNVHPSKFQIDFYTPYDVV